MGVMALLRFLIGDREAILTVARDRSALWLGLVFVLSAGLAREYDGQDLLREPWHLFLPLGASVLTSLLMFATVFWFSRAITDFPEVSGATAGFWGGYRSFLGLFWLMAPMAWLYAIPYERFLGPKDAITANLSTLAVVAVWRFVLMVRIIAVCSDLSWDGAAFCVLLVSAGLLLVALFAYLAHYPPIIALMAGLRDPTEPPDISVGLCCFGTIGVPVVVVVLVVLARAGGSVGSRQGWLASHDHATNWPSWGMLGLAALSLLVWIPILPLTQPEQQKRMAFERAIRKEDYKTAAEALNWPREEFPPGWVPPLRPRDRVTGFSRQVAGMLEALHEQGGPAWAIELYEGRFVRILGSAMVGAPNEVEALTDALPRFPLGRALLEEARKESAKKKDRPEGEDARSYNRRRSLLLILERLEQRKKK
jgi:hypothetical protein